VATAAAEVVAAVVVVVAAVTRPCDHRQYEPVIGRTESVTGRGHQAACRSPSAGTTDRVSSCRHGLAHGLRGRWTRGGGARTKTLRLGSRFSAAGSTTPSCDGPWTRTYNYSGYHRYKLLYKFMRFAIASVLPTRYRVNGILV